MKLSSRQRGFSLLEAIVALTILATSGVALFGWFSVTYDGLERVQVVQARHQLMDNLHVFFSTVNVQQEGIHRMSINEYDVTWHATLVEPEQIGRAAGGALSNFDFGLYDIEINISQNSKNFAVYHTRVVGYRKVRDLNGNGSNGF
jgi:general secretion pathway protein I